MVAAGYLDAVFQLGGYLLSGKCFSPEQYAWRTMIAFGFGLTAGIIGTAATVAAVAFGFAAFPAAIIGLGVGLIVGYALDKYKSRYLDL